ncbi:MAG TPA: phosphatase PAP2 family protein [Proteobacteria bacterium]|nr:phosphatase PAP2 family protein [Pseudomonadota bacterium]
MEHAANNFLTGLSQHALLVYIFIFVVAFSESFAFVGLFVPGAVFAVTAGFLAARGLFDFQALALAGAAGAVLADLASYYLARFYGSRITGGKLYVKYQPYLERGNRFIEKHGGKSVFFGRFVGFIRPVVPFLAGLLKMNSVKFTIYATVSGILWAYLYIGAGYLFGESWKVVEAWTGKLSILLLLIVIILYLARHVARLTGRKLAGAGSFLGSVVGSVAASLSENPYVSGFSSRHPSLAGFFKRRFDKNSASGILLTTGFLVTAFFFYLFIAVVEDVVFHDPLTSLDRTIFYALQGVHSRFADEFFVFITTMGSSVPVMISFLVILGILAINRKRLEAFFFAFNFIGGVVFLMAMKYLFQRPRPEAIYQFFSETTPSFPSGHTFIATAVLGLGLYFLIRFVRTGGARTAAVFSYLLFIFLVGLSRIYLGVHWFSDVLGACFAGFVWISMVITSYEYVIKRDSPKNRGADRSRWIPVAVAVLAVLGVVGNVSYSIRKTGSIIRNVQVVPPVVRKFSGEMGKVVRKEIPPFTETILGNRAAPIQVVFSGGPKWTEGILRASGFVRKDEMRVRDLFDYLVMTLKQRIRDPLPSVLYYYRNRSQRGTWVKSGPDGTYPEMVIRLWNAQTTVNGSPVSVATVDIEKGLYRALPWLELPIPVCNVSLPDARREFRAYLEKRNVISPIPSPRSSPPTGRGKTRTGLDIESLKIMDSVVGRNILHQQYYWDGKILLVRPTGVP